MSVPALTFLAPPPLGDDRSARAATGGRADLRMTRGAREAAAGMKVSDAEIQRCLDAPDDVSPDPTTPSRTRFHRRNLVVTSGADGMVLRVARRPR